MTNAFGPVFELLVRIAAFIGLVCAVQPHVDKVCCDVFKLRPATTRVDDHQGCLVLSQQGDKGWTGKGARTGMGALLLGLHDDQGRLQYAGNVGSGLDDRTLAELTHRLEKISLPSSPFDAGVRIPGKPHLKGRPVSLVRAPSGVGGELFFQTHAKASELRGIKLLNPAFDPDHEALLEIGNVTGLLSAVQMNTLEFHTWNATTTAAISSINKPDRMTFDLDPGEHVGWQQMQEAATLVRTLIEEVGLQAFLKTSGGKGLHVVVPLKKQHDWDTVKGFSQVLVRHLAKTIPQRFVAKSGPKNRVGKIFVDYLRNGFGATTVTAWSARARPGMGVSVPVAWDELPDLTSSAHWTVRNISGRLTAGNTPWAGYTGASRPLTAAMKLLGFKAA